MNIDDLVVLFGSGSKLHVWHKDMDSPGITYVAEDKSTDDSQFVSALAVHDSTLYHGTRDGKIINTAVGNTEVLGLGIVTALFSFNGSLFAIDQLDDAERFEQERGFRITDVFGKTPPAEYNLPFNEFPIRGITGAVVSDGLLYVASEKVLKIDPFRKMQDVMTSYLSDFVHLASNGTEVYAVYYCDENRDESLGIEALRLEDRAKFVLGSYENMGNPMSADMFGENILITRHRTLGQGNMRTETFYASEIPEWKEGRTKPILLAPRKIFSFERPVSEDQYHLTNAVLPMRLKDYVAVMPSE